MFSSSATRRSGSIALVESEVGDLLDALPNAAQEMGNETL